MLTRSILLLLLAGAELWMMPVCGTRGWPAASGAESADKQRFPHPNWDLKYSSGVLAFKKDQWFKAAFARRDEGLVENSAITIPIEELREVYFDPKAQRDSDALEHMPRSGCGYAKDLMPKNDAALAPQIFVAWKVSPGKMRQAAERLNAHDRVRFIWSDGGANKELTFSVNSCEYASFLANLRWASGLRWKDLERKFPQ